MAPAATIADLRSQTVQDMLGHDSYAYTYTRWPDAGRVVSTGRSDRRNLTTARIRPGWMWRG